MLESCGNDDRRGDLTAGDDHSVIRTWNGHAQRRVFLQDCSDAEHLPVLMTRLKDTARERRFSETRDPCCTVRETGRPQKNKGAILL